MRVVFTYDALTHRVRHAWIIEGTQAARMFGEYVNEEIGLDVDVIEPLDPLREILNWRDMGGEPVHDEDDDYLFRPPTLQATRPVEVVTLPGDADKAVTPPGTLHQPVPRLARVVTEHEVTRLGTRGAQRCSCGLVFGSEDRQPRCPDEPGER